MTPVQGAAVSGRTGLATPGSPPTVRQAGSLGVKAERPLERDAIPKRLPIATAGIKNPPRGYPGGIKKYVKPSTIAPELTNASSNQRELSIAFPVRTGPASIERVVFPEERGGPLGELLR